MKTHLLFMGAAVSVLLPMSGLSQALVRFSNMPTDFLTPADRYVYEGFVGGTRLVGTHFMAQLYVGTAAESVTPLGAPANFRMITTTAPGTWVPANIPLTGFAPGTTLTMQVRVWDSTYGATYDAAAAGNRGLSAPFAFIVPPNDTDPYTLENLRAFAVVPEPSSVVLGGLAVLGVWGLRKRRVA